MCKSDMYFTKLLTSVIGIPISLYHCGISSSRSFCGLTLGRLPTGWIRSALLWRAVGVILFGRLPTGWIRSALLWRAVGVILFGRLPTGWIRSALLWRAVGVILLMFDRHLILFLLLHVYSPTNFFVSNLIHSGLSFSSLLLSTCVFLCY